MTTKTLFPSALKAMVEDGTFDLFMCVHLYVWVFVCGGGGGG